MLGRPSIPVGGGGLVAADAIALVIGIGQGQLRLGSVAFIGVAKGDEQPAIVDGKTAAGLTKRLERILGLAEPLVRCLSVPIGSLDLVRSAVIAALIEQAEDELGAGIASLGQGLGLLPHGRVVALLESAQRALDIGSLDRGHPEEGGNREQQQQ